MKRVYVAGPYSSSNVIGVFTNMRRGCNLAHDVLRAGFAPFTPWLDWLLSMFGPVSLQMYRDYSMCFLEACDAVLVQPDGYERSEGTQAEMRRAAELKIPIFFHLEELIAHFEKEDGFEPSGTVEAARAIE